MLQLSKVPFPGGRATDMAAAAAGGGLGAFVARGGRLPIMVVTYNRAAMLRRTLAALMAVRGVRKEDIWVVQDGADAGVGAVLKEGGFQFHQKTDGLRMRGGRRPDGGQRIAGHYGYALRHMFGTAAPWAPGVIVVEDDFLFSVDYYEYFHAVAPLVEADDSIWLASAWNDNGMGAAVRDVGALKRSSYFPGLGWLLPRTVWEGELADIWPENHWDHFLRDVRRHKGRDVVHPEAPRDYHFGIKGTFMDTSTHNRYFKPIAMAANPAWSWFSPEGEAAVAAVASPVFQATQAGELASATLLNSVAELEALGARTGVLYYDSSVEPNTPFRPIAAYFGIWHEPVRGARDGVTRLPWGAAGTVYLVNVNRARHRGAKVLSPRPGARVLSGRDFAGRTRPDSSLTGTAAKLPSGGPPPASPTSLRVFSPLAGGEAEAAFFAGRYDAFGWDAASGLPPP